MKNRFNQIMLCLLAAVGFAVTSCEDYTGKYEMTGGKPTIYYVRPTDAAKADSLLTGAYMGSTVCLVGDNLTSIQELFFNDVKATLNINFITKNTLIVSVPQTLPDAISNKIWMVTEEKDTVGYDFVTQIPNPIISRIYCDNVPEGGTVTLIGDYLLDYPNAHISVTIGNYTVPYENITHVEKTTMSFIAPPADVSGYVTVTSTYGSNTRSYRTLFRDGDPEKVQFITGFEPTENGGTGYVGGWGRPSAQELQNDPALAISGTYVRKEISITGTTSYTTGWNVNIWSSADTNNPNSGIPNPMFSFDPEVAALKFDINVLTPWSAIPFSIFFTPPGDAENCLWDGAGGHPRAFYAPWQAAGPYVTDGWETVTIPLTDFKYSNSGAAIALTSSYSNLCIALHNFGAEAYAGGSECSPVILLDNIRVISME
ncbi:MAG: glycan-binding surface protein [Prevotellaceae bacterium]|jgi:hypothetical protein|nr:glycan-binding surface protein [Prevotellaceae bacterium]